MNNETQTPEVQPAPTPTPVAEAPAAPAQPVETPAASGSGNYATLWSRFAAYLIDFIGFSIIASILGLGTASYGSTGYESNLGSLGSLLFVVYVIAMHIKYGATLGKMALKIKVQNMETGENMKIGEALMRDLLGSFLSGLALGLGFLWAIWDKDKQTWADKFGKTVVVKA